MTANIPTTVDSVPVSASAGSSVGGGKHGKRTATTKTPSVAERAKLLKRDAAADGERQLLAMLSSCVGKPGVYSAGTVINACRPLTAKRLSEIIAALPAEHGLRSTGSHDVLSLKLADFIVAGAPLPTEPKPAATGKAKAGKPVKVTPQEAADTLRETIRDLDVRSMTAAELKDTAEGVLELVQLIPAGKPKDATDLPTLRNLCREFNLDSVTGTKAAVAERICLMFGLLARPVAKPKATVQRVIDIDSLSDAEFADLESRMQARRAARQAAVASGRTWTVEPQPEPVAA